VPARPARDGARFRPRALRAAREDTDGIGGHAEGHQGRPCQVVLLRNAHAVLAQRDGGGPEPDPGEDHDRRDTGVVEVRRLEHAIGERARQHHDGVGVRRQRIGNDQEAARAAHGEHDDEHEEGAGEGEPQEAHGAAKLRATWGGGKPGGLTHAGWRALVAPWRASRR
jgi:hypothetical protein